MRPNCQNVELDKPFSTNPRGPFLVPHIIFQKAQTEFKDQKFYRNIRKCGDDPDLDSSRGHTANRDITAHRAVSLEFFQITEICEIKPIDV